MAQGKTTSGNSDLWDFKSPPKGHTDHKVRSKLLIVLPFPGTLRIVKAIFTYLLARAMARLLARLLAHVLAHFMFLTKEYTMDEIYCDVFVVFM